MATFTLTITIDKDIVKKQSSDNLNIAKKVNGVFTTTFTGASFHPIGKQQQLLQVNTFNWTELYSVLLTSKFVSGMLVSAATTPSAIAFGQEVDCEDVVLSEAKPAPPKAFSHSKAIDSFILGKVPDTFAAAVATKINNNWATIYVDNQQHTGVQSKQLTPQSEYALFFDSTVSTGAMIDYSSTSAPYEFTFDKGSFAKSIRFGYQTPDSPEGGSEQPKWYPN